MKKVTEESFMTTVKKLASYSRHTRYQGIKDATSWVIGELSKIPGVQVRNESWRSGSLEGFDKFL